MSVKQKARVLLVDDDPQILRLFFQILTKGGYSVTKAHRTADALLILEAEPIDLLILDLEMPRPDGFDVLKSLRANRPGLRVLVVSGYAEGALLRASEFLGASASLNKRDAPKLLLETVRRLLQ